MQPTTGGDTTWKILPSVVHLVGKKQTFPRLPDHVANLQATISISESAPQEQATPNPGFSYPNVHGCEMWGCG